jgi:hypothetical protein
MKRMNGHPSEAADGSQQPPEEARPMGLGHSKLERHNGRSTCVSFAHDGGTGGRSRRWFADIQQRGPRGESRCVHTRMAG